MVIVFGSINIDIAVNLARLPERGETVLGHGCVISPGGKGANQAHAARRAGAEVAMVGMVGPDAFAGPALARLREEGVELTHVEETDEPTGCATIWVEEGTGASTIAVASGANMQVTDSLVGDELLEGAEVLLLQHEVPLDENRRLVERAARRGCRILLNAAPAFPVPEDVLAALDILIVNEIEIVQVAAHAGGGDEPPRRLPEWLARPVRTDGGRHLWSRGVALPHRLRGDSHPGARDPAGGHDRGGRHLRGGPRRDARRGP